MGTFSWPMTIASLDGGESQTVDATVDTGAFFTMLPGSMLRQMGLEPEDTVELELADRRTVERQVGHARVTLNPHAAGNGDVTARSVITLVLFGDDSDPILLGAYTLEGLLLAVDPVQQTLIPAHLIMY